MNTTIYPTSRSSILASLTLALAAASGAHAGVYTTTYTLNTPYTLTTPNATQVVVNWSTNATSGLIHETDLTDWSIRLVGSGTDVYTDNAIIGGSVQSLGGVNRTMASIMFNFDLDTLTAGEFDNMLTGSSLSAATGVAYNIYSYFNGNPP
ncbi:MAG: PEP-CTERM sorting domain-containing protein, partial [Planctomycetota bacterium]